jgi:hypothetical protein
MVVKHLVTESMHILSIEPLRPSCAIPTRRANAIYNWFIVMTKRYINL